MIDNPDHSNSTIRLLVFQALKQWESIPLFHLLFDGDYIVRSAAARELQIRGEESIFNKILEIIDDKREFVREICAFSLGQFGTPSFPYKKKSIPILNQLLNDQNDEVRSAAVSSLGYLCSENMPDSIEKRLILMSEDPSNIVRSSVALALGSSSGSDVVINTLNVLKNDKCNDVRCSAETGIEILKD